MTREQRRIINHELFAYKKNKSRCGKVVNIVAYGTPPLDGERVKSGGGNSVENAMIKALNDDIARHNWCVVFEKTMERFKWEQKDILIRARYLEHKNVKQICKELAISRRTYFYWLMQIENVAFMWATELKLL